MVNSFIFVVVALFEQQYNKNGCLFVILWVKVMRFNHSVSIRTCIYTNKLHILKSAGVIYSSPAVRPHTRLPYITHTHKHAKAFATLLTPAFHSKFNYSNVPERIDQQHITYVVRAPYRPLNH